MTDIRIANLSTIEGVSMDWLLSEAGTLDESNELATAVTVALGTDGLAADTDILPDIDDDDRRGWWGDLDAEEIWDGWSIGTRLWLLRRAKIVGPESAEGGTVARVEQYIRESIEPFRERRIVSRFFVEADRATDRRDKITATVTLYRGPLPAIELRFQALWEPTTAAQVRTTRTALVSEEIGLLGGGAMRMLIEPETFNLRMT